MRWNDKIIKKIRATPRVPNVRADMQNEIENETNQNPLKVDVGGDGKDLIPKQVEEADAKVRDFKITKALLERHGHSTGCLGCDQSKVGKRVSGHSKDCRSRIEGAMQKDAVDQARLHNRDFRGGLAANDEVVVEVSADGNLLVNEEPNTGGEPDQDDQSSSSSSSESDISDIIEKEEEGSPRKSKRNEERDESNKRRRIGAVAMARRISNRIPRQGRVRKVMKLERMVEHSIKRKIKEA